MLAVGKKAGWEMGTSLGRMARVRYSVASASAHMFSCAGPVCGKTSCRLGEL